MKVILTGTTGQIGSAVLQACIQDPAITHIFSLARRALPSTVASPKLSAIVHSDFTAYPDGLLAQLAGADTCIWSLGTIPRKGDGTLASYTAADVACTTAAAAAFVRTLAPQLPGRKFRFVYVSGLLAERDSSQSLWLLPAPRFSKGMAESALVKLQSEHPDILEVFVARPGKVVAKASMLPDSLLWAMYANREDQLSAALIDIAKNGYPKEIVHGRELTELGIKLMSESES